MRVALTLFLAFSLAAQVYHRETGERVTHENPAAPGQRLLVIAPEGMEEVHIGGAPVEWTRVDAETIEITLPEEAAGSFYELTLDGVASAIPVNRADGIQLDANEVRDLALRAAMSLEAPRLVVAVVDRTGRPLAIYRRPQATAADVEAALSLARTGAFFSHNQAPLSSRTVRSISTINFPEGIPNQPAAALYGIENTNRGCALNTTFAAGKAVAPATNADGTGPGQGVATRAGGLPLYRNGEIMIGGIGVGGVDANAAEFATVAATFGTPFFVKLPLPPPGAVFVDGFRLPFVFQTTQPPGTQPASSAGGVFQVGPLHGNAAPEEWLVTPRGSATLTAVEVRGIIERSIERANATRAVIRLPLGSRSRMVIGVTDLDGNLLGLYRMPDSTIFSIDVAVAKARNVVYFSGPNADPRDLGGVPAGTAFSNRTIGFGGQPLFPSGILNSQPGPFFDVYLHDLANPCTQGRQPKNSNQSGIVFFPGSAPLYKGGRLVGGLGVSGDGVEQDDYVTASGAQGFEAPDAQRADQIFIRGVRLPYWKFPRNPEQ
ncbi:MAG: heme-binding protein [Acidimicrobiia bacterium]|nr:heme-binding protein [Acidimicrobiia bacterium]